MNQEKLLKIIDDKNNRREDEALRNAADIIDAIAREQQAIVVSTGRIRQLRDDLARLEVEQLDPTAILG